MKAKILNMVIEVEEPEYDEDGQQIVKDIDEEDNPHLDGIFMAHLLDEDYLDSIAYSPTSDEKKPVMLEGQDLQDDIKKHLNVDFDSQHSSQRDLQSEDAGSRRNSLAELDNLANQLDQLDGPEPKSASVVYPYEPKDGQIMTDDEFLAQRDRGMSRVSQEVGNFYGAEGSRQGSTYGDARPAGESSPSVKSSDLIEAAF